MPRLVSGIQPTGAIHIGNYFGAMRQQLELQETHEAFILVVDLHALNQVHDRARLEEGIRTITAAYLAIGLDPNRVTIIQQSQVPAHAELASILGSIAGFGLLERAHAYKDAVANGKQANVGLFVYPILMAADILLYKPDVVPVGRDQQQHIEITVDLAERFNHLFGETFPIPKGYIPDEVATIPGLDGRKMSKSYGNTIGLFEDEESLRKKVMSITTDSKRPEEPKDTTTDSLFALHKLVQPPEVLADLESRYLNGGIGYKESKDILFNGLNNLISPIRDRYNELILKPDYLRDVLAEGSMKAAVVANQTMQSVFKNTGMRP